MALTHREIMEILIGYHYNHGDSNVTFAGIVKTGADTLYLIRVINMGGASYSVLDKIIEIADGVFKVIEVFSSPRRDEAKMIKYATKNHTRRTESAGW